MNRSQLPDNLTMEKDTLAWKKKKINYVAASNLSSRRN